MNGTTLRNFDTLQAAQDQMEPNEIAFVNVADSEAIVFKKTATTYQVFYNLQTDFAALFAATGFDDMTDFVTKMGYLNTHAVTNA